MTNMFLTKTFVVIYLINNIGSVPLSEFFPYGSMANDQVLPPNDDQSTDALSLPRNFPYFNNNHRQIYLANNGFFSFLAPISQFIPTQFPLNDGRRLIAGFWSDIDTRGNISSGNEVYYHIYGNGTDSTIFDKATSYVRQYFPTEQSFSPSMIITGTWFRVGAKEKQTNLTNTFQIVLTTDEIRSFVFILYHELQWASPQTSLSNEFNSLYDINGQAGFNAGDGVIFQMLPYSRTSNVRRLSNLSNVNVPGLFVYRIDTDTTAVGGCGNNSDVLFQPHRGSQLGSTAITFQGPCFTNISDGNIKCRFGDSMVVDGIVINEFQAICLTPLMSLPTFTNIYLSIDGGMTYQFVPGTFTYTPVEYGLSSNDNSEVIILNYTSTTINTRSQINLGWYLSNTTIKTWPNNTIRLQVQMSSIILNDSSGGILGNDSIILQSNITPMVGYQSISVTIPSFTTSNLATIYFRIIARDSLTNKTYAGLNSALFVLYDNTTNTIDHCQTWTKVQPVPSTWNENLSSCPLTLPQARVARCCYEPDPLCTENNSHLPTNCYLHRGRSMYNESSAVACYVSRISNEWNATTECCYDTNGQLITRGLGAGTDDRYQPSSFPILHFFQDTLPYLACCLLNTSKESCDSYFDLRPHRRGSNLPTTLGGTWGDPHFMTFDGSLYTFNGFGEYTYLAITNLTTSLRTAFDSSTQTLIFNSQIRTTPLCVLNSTATVIRGFAARSNHSLAENMSITISRQEMLIVRRGNETLDLETTNEDRISTNNSLILFFPELTLTKNRTSGTLTLSWSIGISIQITPISINNSLILNIDISLSGIYQNRTFGLLGVYDDNPTNDLQAQNGTIIGLPDTLTFEQIHRQFGQTWAVNPNRSLFYYDLDNAAFSYTNLNLLYIPSFVSPELSTSQMSSALTVCHIDSSFVNQSTWTIAQQTCYYDIVATNDISLGQTSRMAADTILQSYNDQRYPPEFISELPLILTAYAATPTIIDFTAISPYTTSIIYTLVNGPSAASFNVKTALFNWSSPSLNDTNTVVRITAQDTQYNLLSTQELTIRVIKKDMNNTITSSSHRDIMPISSTFIFINAIGILLFL